MPDLAPPPRRRELTGEWLPPIGKRESLQGRWRFKLLNEERDLSFPEDWNPPGLPRLWVYNLHYFDDLNAFNAAERTELHRDLMIRWVEDNAPSCGPGWEPYPTSLRIVNWIKWVLAGNEPPQVVDHSLAVQARWLLRRVEYHLLGNHLLANAKALIFAGVYFDGPEAEAWRRKGERILRNQLPEQILPDGGHYERSPMYHLLVLEDLLDLVNLYSAYKRQIPVFWYDAIERMLEWSRFMRHPDGEIPFFNDASIGIAPPPEEIDRYAESLGFDVGEAIENGCLSESGYCRMTKDGVVLFVDCGPIGPDFQPGHAHADTLSFEVSVQGRRLLVNSGTSTYEWGPERAHQRGSEAHNTLVIDGLDSSEVWSAFRVARRARVSGLRSDFGGSQFIISARHDGYIRLSKAALHERTWRLSDDGLEILDRISGQGRHHVELFFHLHPGVDIKEDCGVINLSWAGSERKIAILDPDPAVHVSVESYAYHPGFGRSIPSRRVVCRAEVELPCTLTTRIEWVRS